MAPNTRQKVILYLVHKSGGQVGKTELMKWLFLYSRQEQKESNHYDFVPYKFGPFSFEAHQNINISLAAYLESNDRGIRPRPGNEYELASAALKLGAKERALADRIYKKYSPYELNDLINEVYTEFPWYASRSELRPIRESEESDVAIYTVGYEGRSIDSFFDHLLKSGLRGIIDVRRNAYSRKYGFSSYNLPEISRKLGFSYIHLPQLGIASELRKDLSDPVIQENLFRSYEQELPSKGAAVEDARREIMHKPSALLCFEANSKCCHRGRLAQRLSDLTGSPIVHL
jgi:hypothetical protein